MRKLHTTVFSAVAFVAACAGPAEVRRTESPRAVTSPTAVRIDEARPNQPLDEAATQKWLAGEIASQQQKAAPVTEPKPAEQVVPKSDRGLSSRTDETATKAWLQQTIDERRAMEDQNLPPPPPVVETRTVYVDRYATPYGYGYDAYGNPIYYGSSYAYGDPYCRPYGRGSFPIFTATGATIGAFANSRHSRGRNIALGAGIGFLFDLGSRCW